MNRWKRIAMLGLTGALLPSCGLIKAPFRVAGAVVDHSYRAGKGLAKKTAKALEGDPDKKKEKKDAKKAPDKKQDPTHPARGGELPPGMPAGQPGELPPGAPADLPGELPPGMPPELPAELPPPNPNDTLPPLPEDPPPL